MEADEDFFFFDLTLIKVLRALCWTRPDLELPSLSLENRYEQESC